MYESELNQFELGSAYLTKHNSSLYKIEAISLLGNIWREAVQV